MAQSKRFPFSAFRPRKKSARNGSMPCQIKFRKSPKPLECVKSMSTGYETIRKKGFNRPKNPPSVFLGSPSTYLPKTVSPPQRETEKRNIDFDSRYVATKQAKLDADRLRNWADLVAFCNKLNYTVNEEKYRLSIYQISPPPPSITFFVIINTDCSVSCYNRSEKVAVRNFFVFLQKWSFTHRLKRY